LLLLAQGHPLVLLSLSTVVLPHQQVGLVQQDQQEVRVPVKEQMTGREGIEL
jgi:hypothetical protein